MLELFFLLCKIAIALALFVAAIWFVTAVWVVLSLYVKEIAQDLRSVFGARSAKTSLKINR